MLHWKFPKFIDESVSDQYLDIFTLKVRWVTFSPSPSSRLVHIWDSFSEDEMINDIIFNIIRKLKDDCNVTECQGVFMNNYINGEDYCPYHKDRYESDVYTVSLGSSRDLLIKEDGSKSPAEKISLDSGDLYFMSKELNDSHKHSVPVRKNVKRPRISLVFFCVTDNSVHPPVCRCWNCEEERKELHM